MLKKLKTFIDDPRLNLCGAFVSVALEVVSWFTLQDWKYPTPVAFALTVLFLGRLAWTQYWQADAYRESQKPQLQIVFDDHPEVNGDNRPFFQKLKFGHIPSAGAVMIEMLDRRYRVGIRNLSNTLIPNVQLVLAKCVPGGNFIHPAHRLLVTDSDPPEAQRDLVPSKDGSATLWFDVVNEVGPSARVPEQFHFCFANPNICGPVDGADYTITLRCEGGGTYDERQFVIRKGWNNDRHEPERLTMKPHC